MTTNKNNSILMIIGIAIVALGVGFFGGMKYQQSQRQSFSRQFGMNQQQGTRGGNGSVRGGFRPVNGEILSTDANSITVKLPDGSSKIVLLSDKTEINKASVATVTDLTAGEKVSVFGTENTDGSVSATSVQLNPLFGRLPTPGNQ